MINRAVMVSADIENERLRLVLDDLVLSSENEFKKDVLYTIKDFDLKQLEDMNFQEEELAAFGYAVLARLRAFYKVDYGKEK